MAKRINGQFDDKDQSYRVEKIVVGPGYIRSWQQEGGYVSLKNAEAIARRISADGTETRVKHESDY